VKIDWQIKGIHPLANRENTELGEYSVMLTKFGLGGLAVLAVAGVTAPIATLTATPVHAQGFAANAPFVSGAGVASASQDEHFINITVAAFPLEGLVIECENLSGVESVTITDQFGNTIENSFSAAGGDPAGTALTVNFAQPVPEGNEIRVVLNGVERVRGLGEMLYRVSAIRSDLSYAFPVGTARLIEGVGD